MIESIMIFALGFLAAALIALLIIPAINARADRLARRRAAALFPLSISELTAEKDHLRAEFAVLQRKIERKAEEALAFKHQSMEELGRRAVQIEALETTLGERGRYIETLEKDLAETRQRLQQTDEEFTGTKGILSATRETLAAVEDAHRKTLDELASTRRELDRANTLLVGLRAELAATQDKLAVREAAYSALETAHTTALNEIDAKRITISDLETRLAMQTARGNDFERALGDRRSELSEERQRLADLAKSLAAEQERGLLLDQRIRELEQERNEQADKIETLSARAAALPSDKAPDATPLTEREEALVIAERKLAEARSRIAALEASDGGHADEHATELRTVSDRYEVLKAEKAALQGALQAAREEQARLSNELKVARAKQEEGGAELRAENEELRRRIEEVANQIMRSAEVASEPDSDGASETPAEARATKGRRSAARRMTTS